MRLPLLVFAAGMALGQPPAPAPAAQFEVVSIKPHPEPIAFSSNMTRGASYRGVAIKLLDLIEDAYNLQPDQVSGGPGWVKTEHFDIDAQAPGDGALSMERARPMLQTMLADRFKLKVRHEAREVAAYDLVAAKGGPKLKENRDPAVRPGLVTSAAPGAMHLQAGRVTMARLAMQLAFGAGRPVVDRTGLTGEYQFTLDYAPDNSPAAIDGSAATLFTALQEQLGLRLEPSRTTQEMLIIESAEKPSPN